MAGMTSPKVLAGFQPRYLFRLCLGPRYWGGGELCLEIRGRRITKLIKGKQCFSLFKPW